MAMRLYIPVREVDELFSAGRDIPISLLPGGVPFMQSGAAVVRPTSFVAIFSDNAVADGVTDFRLPLAGVTDASFVIPRGWSADIYRLSMFCVGDGDDITAITAKLFLDGQDASADFDALTLDPSLEEQLDVGPLVPPYTIGGSGSFAELDVRVTTNGTGGTMGAVVQIIGTMYRTQ